jgi:hypothetical protein
VVSDIDGTLTTPDRRLSVAGATAIMRLEAVGIPVLLASGNVMPSVRAFALMLGASGPLVAENGGMVAYRGTGWRETIDIIADRKVADEAYAVLKEQMPEVRPLLTQRWRESEIALEMGPDVDAIREVVKDFPVHIETSGYSPSRRGAGIWRLGERHHHVRGRRVGRGGIAQGGEAHLHSRLCQQVDGR